MGEVIFDERVAERYDHDVAARFDPTVVGPTVDRLVELAEGGAALEFAVGTGRIAIPLSQRGVPVHGIDISEPMVEQMRAKPGADAVEVSIGDIATTRVPGSFRLVYLVFNTINNLLTQDEQVACFANAAAHLEPGGSFVIEVGVPDLRRLPPGETVKPFTVTPTYIGFDEFTDLTHAQTMWSHHRWSVDGRLEAVDMQFRYVWPAELDLMARLAGMELRHRWAGWNGEPFTGDSRSHVSVWALPA